MHLDLFEDLLGKQFEYHGRGPDKYDCIGLCLEVSSRVGVEIPALVSYTEPSEIHNAITNGKELFTQLKAPVDNVLVLLQIHPKFVTHIGFVLKHPYFIHIMPRRQVAIERLDSTIWKHRVRGYFI